MASSDVDYVRPGPPEGRSGFSLVELLIVVSLLGILIAVALPRLETSAVDQLQGAARILVADLDYARNLAVTNNSTYLVQFDLSNNLYQLSHDGTNAALDVLPATPFFQDLGQEGSGQAVQVSALADWPLNGPPVQIVSIRAETNPATTVQSVSFGPLGSTTRAVATVIWLGSGVGDDRRYLSIRVSPVTGLAVVGQIQLTVPGGEQPA